MGSAAPLASANLEQQDGANAHVVFSPLPTHDVSTRFEKKIWILRHGLGWHNMCDGTAYDERTGKWVTTGHDAQDAQLTARGERQASSWNNLVSGTNGFEADATTEIKALLGSGVELIISSPLKRCLQTALLALGGVDQDGSLPRLPIRICRHAREIPFDDLCNECDDNAGRVHEMVSALPRGHDVLELAGVEQQEILAAERQAMPGAPQWGTGSLDEALVQPSMDVTDWRGHLWKWLSDTRRKHATQLKCWQEEEEEEEEEDGQVRADSVAAVAELSALEAADTRTPEQIAAEGPSDVRRHIDLLQRAMPPQFMGKVSFMAGSSSRMVEKVLDNAHRQAVLVNLKNELAARPEKEILLVAHWGVIHGLLHDDGNFTGFVGNCDIVETTMNELTKRLTWVTTHECPFER